MGFIREDLIWKWIGEQVNTSGSYYERGTKELKFRTGGYTNAKKLYLFESRFGEKYYISDEKAVEGIEEMINDEEKSVNLIEFLYNLVIQKFGVIEFIVRIGHKIAEQRDEGYKEGKYAKQQEIRKVLFGQEQ